jgi:Putative DNA-binding domain
MDELSEIARQAAVLAAWRSPLPLHVPQTTSLAAALGASPSEPLDTRQASCPALPDLHQARMSTDAAGLRAYQLNAQATAQRVLASTFPTVAAMLGQETLDAMALILWQQHPPEQGDLGEWGATLPALLACHPHLQAWPWLPDCARLDWARHACERAADATLDADSLLRLGDTDPALLRLWLKPCVQVIPSAWPIHGLFEAHQGPQAAHALAAARSLQEDGPQTVVVWRQPWQAQMQSLQEDQAVWMRALLPAECSAAPRTLATLLDQAPAPFDFEAWLVGALNQGWLWRVTVGSPND